MSLNILILTPKTERGVKIRKTLLSILDGKKVNILDIDSSLTHGGSWVDPLMETIRKADLIFCDITEENSNLFYELGAAHVLDKVTVLLKSRDSEIGMPANLQGFLYYTYSSINPRSALERITLKAIDEFIKQDGEENE